MVKSGSNKMTRNLKNGLKSSLEGCSKESVKTSLESCSKEIVKTSLKGCSKGNVKDRLKNILNNILEGCSNSSAISIIKNVAIIVLTLMCMIVLPLSLSIKSYAAVSGAVNEIVSQTHAYEEPDTSSGTILDLEVGDLVFVTGEKGEFYVIYYKELTGYVPKYAIDGTDASISETGVSTNPDAAALASSSKAVIDENNKAVDEELKDQEEYNKILEEVIEQKTRAKRNSIIWVCVIIVLCALMIAAAVASVVINSKKGDKADKVMKTNKDATTDKNV